MVRIVEIAKRYVLLWSLGIFFAGVLVGALVSVLLKSISDFWLWYLWAVISTASLLWLVTAIWDKAPGIAESPGAEKDGLGLVCILGTIGGFIRWMHRPFETSPQTLPQTLPENHSLVPLLWPLEGAALSLIVVLLLRAGVISSSAVERSKAVNWLGLYAIAGLTGLCANEAVTKLVLVFAALFGKGGS